MQLGKLSSNLARVLREYKKGGPQALVKASQSYGMMLPSRLGDDLFLMLSIDGDVSGVPELWKKYLAISSPEKASARIPIDLVEDLTEQPGIKHLDIVVKFQRQKAK
jgi:hypothetical protein